ncbi:hypothetical protein DPMN_089397 [Dreissena polymorpha]|uniref:EGF-like domain-containing protein n=1 Tax=Dreissena polymorpha TaxID=45954 RepID=A0A9D4KWS5_DREPO|nr:hypothetical protein DPMN_089397 [Dreissena polymorpha]
MCMQTGLETTSQRSTTIIPRLDACNSSYVLRPVKERSCMGMYNCVYGTCFTQAKMIVCQRDIGVAPGQLCEHKCCKDCGAHGRCYYNVTQKEERCNCDANYTGSMCEIYNPPGTMRSLLRNSF